MGAWAAGGCLAACLWWLGAGVLIRRHLGRLKDLRAVEAPDPAPWPSLSVLIPARDEAEVMDAAAATLLAQDYPDLEVILVDDRSADGTGALMDALAARDPRVAALHVAALPAGWLGKVHALETARKRARGTWLLATDADVHFAPGCLKRAVAAAEAERLDHLALMPDIPRTGLWRDVAVAAFCVAGFVKLDPARIGRPGSGQFAGVGAFNLVRADALAAAGGMAELRLEVIDDFGLGWLLHRAGARGALRGGRGLVAVNWYSDLKGFMRGLEKNAFAVARYSYARAAAAAAFPVLLAAGLVLTPWAVPAPWGWAAAAAALAGHALLVGSASRRLGIPAFLHLLAPAGGVLLGAVLARSAWAAWRRGGIAWRGTLYPLRELRAHQRVKL